MAMRVKTVKGGVHWKCGIRFDHVWTVVDDAELVQLCTADSGAKEDARTLGQELLNEPCLVCEQLFEAFELEPNYIEHNGLARRPLFVAVSRSTGRTSSCESDFDSGDPC